MSKKCPICDTILTKCSKEALKQDRELVEKLDVPLVVHDRKDEPRKLAFMYVESPYKCRICQIYWTKEEIDEISR